MKFKNTQHWREKGGEYAKDLDKRLRKKDNNAYLIQRDDTINIVKNLEFNSMLEIGCNNGRIIGEIYKLFPDKKYYGCDISLEALKILKKRYPKIKTKEVDITKGLPYKEFDLILDCECLCHISCNEIDSVIKEIKRVAKKYIVISEVFKSKYKHRETVSYKGNSHFGTWSYCYDEFFKDCDIYYNQSINNKVYLKKL